MAESSKNRSTSDPVANSGDIVPQGADDARAAATARFDYLDVIKGYLIIVVVFAHLIEHLGTYNPLFMAAYGALSLYGLPVFVLASGMVAKPALGDRDYRKMVAKLLLPLLVLQPFYLALYARAGGDAVAHILDPQWLLWFLLSLLLWRMMLPLFIRIPFALIAAVCITVVAGYAQFIGPDLSLSRTLYFFPFFLAGFLWRDKILKIVSRLRPLWGTLFIGMLAGAGWWFLHGLDIAVVYHDRGYQQTAVWQDYPELGRLGLLVVSSVGCLAWMATMPRSSKFLVRMGRRSLTVLALHGFVVLVCLKIFNVVGWTYAASLWLFPVMLVLAVTIAWVVSLLDTPFNRFFDGLAFRLARFAPTR